MKQSWKYKADFSSGVVPSGLKVYRLTGALESVYDDASFSELKAVEVKVIYSFHSHAEDQNTSHGIWKQIFVEQQIKWK